MQLALASGARCRPAITGLARIGEHALHQVVVNRRFNKATFAALPASNTDNSGQLTQARDPVLSGADPRPDHLVGDEPAPQRGVVIVDSERHIDQMGVARTG